MGRRKASGQSSLELLLDTICNTFGGVLFLAILVSVLLRNSSQALHQQQISERDEPDSSAVEQELDRELEELRVLQAAIAVQNAVEAQLIEPHDGAALAELQAAQNERNTLQSRVLEMQRKLAEHQLKVAALEKSSVQASASLKAAMQDRIDAEQSLRSEIASRTQEVRLPRVHFSRKTPIGMLVKFGRLYLWHRYDASGERVGINTADMIVVESDASRVRVIPKPYGGVLLEARDSAESIRKLLRPFRPASNSITFVVWEDSFEAFEQVKSVAVNLGFEYRLMPTREGNTIVDQGGKDSNVQ